MIVVPSTAVETMGLGTIAGLAALGASTGLPGRPSGTPPVAPAPSAQAGAGKSDGGSAASADTPLPDITTIVGGG